MTLDSPYSTADIEQASKLFKVISDPTHLSILLLLKQNELSVGSIAETLQMEQSAISHQLKTLKQARLVRARREKKAMIYSLNDLHIFSILDQVIHHINEEQCDLK